jgi:hypothetical protein
MAARNAAIRSCFVVGTAIEFEAGGKSDDQRHCTTALGVTLTENTDGMHIFWKKGLLKTEVGNLVICTIFFVFV